MRSKKKTKRWMETQSRSDLKPGCIETFDNTPTPEEARLKLSMIGPVMCQMHSGMTWALKMAMGLGRATAPVLCTNSSKLKMSFTYIAL